MYLITFEVKVIQECFILYCIRFLQKYINFRYFRNILAQKYMISMETGMNIPFQGYCKVKNFQGLNKFRYMEKFLRTLLNQKSWSCSDNMSTNLK